MFHVSHSHLPSAGVVDLGWNWKAARVAAAVAIIFYTMMFPLSISRTSLTLMATPLIHNSPSMPFFCRKKKDGLVAGGRMEVAVPLITNARAVDVLATWNALTSWNSVRAASRMMTAQVISVVGGLCAYLSAIL